MVKAISGRVEENTSNETVSWAFQSKYKKKVDALLERGLETTP